MALSESLRNRIRADVKKACEDAGFSDGQLVHVTTSICYLFYRRGMSDGLHIARKLVDEYEKELFK